MSQPRKSLSDILRGQDQEAIKKQFSETKAAEEFTPIPAGEYVARLVGGEFANSKTNSTPGYKLDFQIIDGDYAGRHLWMDVWFTPDAMPLAKRDLGKLGITDLAQLEGPVPEGIRVNLKVALRKDDDGVEYNRIRNFEVMGVDRPDNPFPPSVTDATSPRNSSAPVDPTPSSDIPENPFENKGSDSPFGEGV